MGGRRIDGIFIRKMARAISGVKRGGRGNSGCSVLLLIASLCIIGVYLCCG